ncbi:MAG: hypothetical protein AB8B55_07165 [Mariniblastus sp.]
MTNSQKKNGCLKILALIFLAFAAMIVLWGLMNFRSTPAPGTAVVKPSVETTVLTGPLNANGDVDYMQAFNNELSDGVTRENNVLVKLVEVIGPISNGERMPDAFFKKLLMEPLPSGGDYYTYFPQWLESQNILNSQPTQTNYRIHLANWEGANSGPWDPKQFPTLEKWHQANKKHLDAIREAVKRSRYYLPWVPDKSNRIIKAQLYLIQDARKLSRHLQIAAMRNLALGEPAKALDDVLAQFRLASLFGQSATVLEELHGIAISGIANDTAKEIFASRSASSQVLLDFAKELEQIPPVRNFARCVGKGERYYMLDAITGLGRGETELLGSVSGNEGAPNSNPLAGIALQSVQFEETFLVVNRWYEKLEEIALLENDIERLEKLSEYETEIQALEQDLAAPLNVVLTVAGGRRAKGRALGEALISLFSPALQQIATSELRSKAGLRMTKIATAIAAYEADLGEYPKSLDVLVPKYIAAIPNDPFVNAPFKYKTFKQGILLYSVFMNKTDEGGSEGSGYNGDWPVYWGVDEDAMEAQILDFADDETHSAMVVESEMEEVVAPIEWDSMDSPMGPASEEQPTGNEQPGNEQPGKEASEAKLPNGSSATPDASKEPAK